MTARNRLFQIIEVAYDIVALPAGIITAGYMIELQKEKEKSEQLNETEIHKEYKF